MVKGLLGAGVLASVLLCASSRAQAQEDDDEFGTLRVVGTVGLGLADVGFLAGDLYFGSEGEWLPRHAAWTQLVLMAPANFAMGILTLDHGTEGAWLALGVGEFVIGTWFAVHGMLSLLGQPDEPVPAGPPATAFVVNTWPGGAVAALAGRL